MLSPLAKNRDSEGYLATAIFCLVEFTERSHQKDRILGIRLLVFVLHRSSRAIELWNERGKTAYRMHSRAFVHSNDRAIRNHASPRN